MNNVRREGQQVTNRAFDLIVEMHTSKNYNKSALKAKQFILNEDGVSACFVIVCMPYEVLFRSGEGKLGDKVVSHICKFLYTHKDADGTQRAYEMIYARYRKDIYELERRIGHNPAEEAFS
jgi:hypothetical protein